MTTSTNDRRASAPHAPAPQPRLLPPHDMLTRTDIVRALECSDLTLRRMIRAGKFPPPLRLTAKTLRWPRAAVAAALGLEPTAAETTQK